jgi:hypothetical protein
VRSHVAELGLDATIGTLRDLAGIERVVRVDFP